MEDLLDLNPHLTREELMRGVTFEEDGCTLKDWNFGAAPAAGGGGLFGGGAAPAAGGGIFKNDS